MRWHGLALMLGLVVLQACGDTETPVSIIPPAGGPDVDSFGLPWAGVAYGSLTDTRDGRSYRTVQVGTRTWMAQNLAFQVDSSWCSGGKEDICDKYGRLYLWSSAMALPDSCDRKSCAGTESGQPRQGICPTGWYLPTDADWQELVDKVGSTNPARLLKSQAGWLNGGNGVDAFGFRVLPGGERVQGGGYRNLDTAIAFWSSDESAPGYAWRRSFFYYTNDAVRMVPRVGSYKWHGFAVRCIQRKI